MYFFNDEITKQLLQLDSNDQIVWDYYENADSPEDKTSLVAAWIINIVSKNWGGGTREELDELFQPPNGFDEAVRAIIKKLDIAVNERLLEPV
ncbi:hypothetical protein JCM19232_2619 [Vibrio ishigakensis]|uniref:Uncharacterized protein n=1 Tax=Vibrio ishigakensis TaxID=1481914 RepID=A0A0B8PLQ6_9VIBR|nr:hypothetical protein JCM19232_2619 [Vibrio ishigakensis]